MPITELIVNEGFETGAFPPWVPSQAKITLEFKNSGYYGARLIGGTVNSFISQFVRVNPGESFEFLVSLAKIGAGISPPVSLFISYYDSSLIFLGYGLITNIPTDSLPDVDENIWLEIYETTNPTPAGATKALVLINKLPQAGSTDIVVDDVSLIVVEDVSVPTGSARNNRTRWNNRSNGSYRTHGGYRIR